MELQFKPLIERQFVISESPVFDERKGRLLYCGIHEHLIVSTTLDGTDIETFEFPSEVGSFGLARSGKLVVALHDRLIKFDRATGAQDVIATFSLPAEVRLNDGRVGPDGAYWVGTMHDASDRRPICGLFRVAPDGSVEEKVTGTKISNGLAFSPDGRVMYYGDTTEAWIDRWDFDPATGRIANRQRFATLDDPTGRPDGAACDVDGFYWSAGLTAMRLNRFAPDGRFVESYDVPGAPTMPCFAGKDRRQLAVTTIRFGRKPEVLERYPLTGGIFIATLNTPVAGLPEHRFAD